MSIAFLDFDGTLLRYQSGVLCAIPSIRRGLIGPRLGARLISTYLLARVGVRPRRAAQRVGFECYGGRTLEELRALMQELHDEHLRAWLSPAMRARVEAHRERGDRTVILTASAFFFAEPLAREWGLDEVIGTQVGFEGGICTGIVHGDILDGEAKLRAAERCAEREGVALDGCAFYTDHVADLPLLERVGKPCVVGPHQPLAKIARARGWPIVAHQG